jgi:hypothetical protein
MPVRTLTSSLCLALQAESSQGLAVSLSLSGVYHGTVPQKTCHSWETQGIKGKGRLKHTQNKHALLSNQSVRDLSPLPSHGISSSL